MQWITKRPLARLDPILKSVLAPVPLGTTHEKSPAALRRPGSFIGYKRPLSQCLSAAFVRCRCYPDDHTERDLVHEVSEVVNEVQRTVAFQHASVGLSQAYFQLSSKEKNRIMGIFWIHMTRPIV